MSTTLISLAFENGCSVSFDFPQPPNIALSTVAAPSLGFDVGTIVYANVSDYGGAYEATPTSETQVFSTEGKRMLGDFTVAPIPNNYGLITWDGSTITVS